MERGPQDFFSNCARFNMGCNTSKCALKYVYGDMAIDIIWKDKILKTPLGVTTQQLKPSKVPQS